MKIRALVKSVAKNSLSLSGTLLTAHGSLFQAYSLELVVASKLPK